MVLICCFSAIINFTTLNLGDFQMKLNYSAITISMMLAFGSVSVFAADNDTPPNPKAGECYARVYTPPKTQTTYEQVVVKEATKQISVVPAVYGTGQETVLVSEASKKLMVKPATYKTVTEEIVVKPASTRLEVIPATYTTKTETIVVSEARTEWKRGRAWLGKAINTKTYASENGVVDDDVMCLVEIPAVTKQVTTRVEATPATTREVVIPEVKKTITKRVVDEPASTYEVEIPAQYNTVTVTKVVTPPQERVIEIPAVYGQVAKTKTVSEGTHEWRSILCETNATPVMIKNLQSALMKAGYNPGPIDGVIRNSTMRAVNMYQSAKGLPVDPYINMETVKSLGL
jgi:hypothetical protein